MLRRRPSCWELLDGWLVRYRRQTRAVAPQRRRRVAVSAHPTDSRAARARLGKYSVFDRRRSDDFHRGPGPIRSLRSRRDGPVAPCAGALASACTMPTTANRPPRQLPPRIALGPEGAPEWMVSAIIAGGGHVVVPEKAHGLIWASPRDPAGLAVALRHAPNLQWIQLPFAGIEDYLHLVDDERLWTCGKGVYAEPVAELALALALAGLRGLGAYARADRWEGPSGRNCWAVGSRSGRCGITVSLLGCSALHCQITVVRNGSPPWSWPTRSGRRPLLGRPAGRNVVILASPSRPERGHHSTPGSCR